MVGEIHIFYHYFYEVENLFSIDPRLKKEIFAPEL